jgi:S1-C subfamily serine protease
MLNIPIKMVLLRAVLGGTRPTAPAAPIPALALLSFSRVVPQLIRKGKYLRPAMGIEIDENINQRLTEMPGVDGVVILRAPSGSVAAVAGLKGVKITRNGSIVPGDIVTTTKARKCSSLLACWPFTISE